MFYIALRNITIFWREQRSGSRCSLTHSSVAEIRPLEQTLIPVADEWNKSHGLGQLLNKQE
jgi:hypothetical protein